MDTVKATVGEAAIGISLFCMEKLNISRGNPKENIVEGSHIFVEADFLAV